MKQQCNDCMGQAVFFEGISYQCPNLKLYGYATERQLRAAIRRELAKRPKPPGPGRESDLPEHVRPH